MGKYRKKPVVIEAWLLTDEAFDCEHLSDVHVAGVVYDPVLRVVRIKTLEGMMIANVGDWIIRGVKGELYPCKPEIFDMTYESVD